MIENLEEESTKTKLSTYYCENNACGYYVQQLKKLAKLKKEGASKERIGKIHLRWVILRAFLAEGSFVQKTYCPNCKWELRIGLFDTANTKKVERKGKSVLDLLKEIPTNEE